MYSSQKKTLIVPPQSYKSIGTESEKLLQILYPQGLQSPCSIPIIKIVNDNMIFEELTGFRLVVDDLTPGVLGQTDFSQNLITIPSEIFYAALAGDGRARFTIAHEVGHVWLHNNYFQGCILENKVAVANRSNIRTFEDPEWQAEAFASAILMPASMVKQSRQQGLKIQDIQDRFEVSHKAVVKRLEKMWSFL